MGHGYADGAELDESRQRQCAREAVPEIRLREAVDRINPELPANQLDESVRRAQPAYLPTLIEQYREAHKLLVEGIPVDVRHEHGTEEVPKTRLIDFEETKMNGWIAVRQLTVVEESARPSSASQPQSWTSSRRSAVR